MSSHRWNDMCGKSLHLHRMNDSDDLNLYYRKFLNKLSKICLKIFLPLLPLIYFLTLFLCRLFLCNPAKFTFDVRVLLSLLGIVLTFMLLFLIRLHTKWKTLWFCTRVFLVGLLAIPLVLTHQTEQYHILLSTISITLIYSLLTFTLIQSVCIGLTISALHVGLLLNQRAQVQWRSIEFLALVLYHLIINLAGLYAYVRSLRHIREHFHAYETSLYDKNKFNVDCKKLNTIIGHCQQAPHFIGQISKLTNALTISSTKNVNRKYGTVINCNLSLNEQTRQHTCDELASLFDVLYCQIEQLILKHCSQAKYTFDNETIVIVLFDDNNDERVNIDQSCRLAIELFRFIQHVNSVTQWCLTSIVGIDYNELTVLSAEYVEGLACDYSRWLREECLIINRIHVSSRIHDALNENKFYEFHAYSWLTNKHFLEKTCTYFLFSVNMYEPHRSELSSINNSSMIDQLTRIQAQHHVERHLGTITLTRSLRKRSLIELTAKHLHWGSLNFREQYDQDLTRDFQSLHRATNPDLFVYFFVVLILCGSLCQALVLRHIDARYFVSFSSVILGLLLLILVFLYVTRSEQSRVTLNGDKNHRKFYVYFNILICLTLATLFMVAIQYHSIQNFKSLVNTNELSNTTAATMMMNETSSQMNFTSNETFSSDPTPSFDRQYHEYLVLSSIYPLYLCSIYRQCSWIIKSLFIISCLLVQLFLFEYIWSTTNQYFPSIHRLRHYTAFTLIVLHGILLIVAAYVREWLEKIDFVWLKQIENERLAVVRQRDELVKQTSLYFPPRVINYYLRPDADAVPSQHYHTKYDRMGLLYMTFYPSNVEHEYMLIEYLRDVEYLLKNNEKYQQIVMHRKSTLKEVVFSIDTDTDDATNAIQQLVELLLQLEERLKQLSSSSLQLAACLHLGCVHEILIHLENYPKIDLWSEQISLLQLLMSKTQVNHCLTTAAVYHLLNELYLFRTAGMIVSAQVNNTNIYYLLGRLIGDNVFQGRNALPLTIGHNNMDTVQKSSSTDESHHSQSFGKLNCQKEENHIQMSTTTTTTTTTTSSSVVLNEQQSLLKQPSSRKHVRISNHFPPVENPSYRQTLLQALNGSPSNSAHLHQQINPIKKITNRLITKKESSPSVLKDYVPRMVQLSDNSCWSSREAMTPSETSGSKCLILTQQMLNGSADDNSRCRSTPPPPAGQIATTNRHLCTERKSFTEEDFRQLLQEKSARETHNPSRSLSTTNEETASSFSGWDDIPSSPIASLKSNHTTTQPQELIKSTSAAPPPPPIVDCYYPRRPCDLSFTVNMTTTEDESSSRTDTKTTVIHSPASTVTTITSPVRPTPVTMVNSAAITPTQSSQPTQPKPFQAPAAIRYRPVPFDLARKLVAETSESALSDISIDQQQQHDLWTQNSAYQSKHPPGARLSSSYSNLHDLVQMHDLSKFLPKEAQLPPTAHGDLLQRWLEDQLALFRHQVKQTPPSSARRTKRFSTNIALKNVSTDDESDTASENKFAALKSQPHSQSKVRPSTKRAYEHVRYKSLRKNPAQTSHLIRHESLKHRNRPLLFDHTAQLSRALGKNHGRHVKKPARRVDSSSMPRSDLSDISSSRADNLSESVISNLESEYDNIYAQPTNAHTSATIMTNSQLLSDDEEEDDDDDETTLAAAVASSATRCYF